MLWRHLKGDTSAQIRGNLRTAQAFYNQRLNCMMDALKFTGLGDRFSQAIDKTDMEYLEQYLESARREASVDLLLAVDATGRVVFRSHRPDLRGDAPSDVPHLRQALESKKTVSGTALASREFLSRESPSLAERARIPIVATRRAAPSKLQALDSGMILCAAAPVFNREGKFVGALWAGALLNRSSETVDQIQTMVFGEEQFQGRPVGTATIFQDDVRISTNVRKEDGSRAIGSRVSAEVRDYVLERGQTWVGPAWVFNAWYISAYSPILDANNKAIGMLYVGMLKEKFDSMAFLTFTIFTIVTSVGILVAVIFAWWLSESITRPIANIAQASVAIARGDLSIDLPVESKDETGMLTRSFNTMMQSLKQREELFKEDTRQQLIRSERLASIGRLAAGVAHEINNPLTGVLSFAHMLLRDAPSNSRAEADIKTIIEATMRCKEIVKGLLTFSRQKEPSKITSDLNELLRKSVSLTQSQAIIHKVRVIEKLDANLPRFIMDPNQIEEVCVNIIVNAIDAMPEGGDLTLLTTEIEEKGEHWAQFVITDTGFGIAPEVLDRIFEPFFTTKESDKGTGLGLALSYGIVMEHNGRVDVSTELNQGTSITVRLPVITKED